MGHRAKDMGSWGGMWQIADSITRSFSPFRGRRGGKSKVITLPSRHEREGRVFDLYCCHSGAEPKNPCAATGILGAWRRGWTGGLVIAAPCLFRIDRVMGLG